MLRHMNSMVAMNARMGWLIEYPSRTISGKRDPAAEEAAATSEILAKVPVQSDSVADVGMIEMAN